MDRKVFWEHVFTEVLRQNGGKAAEAAAEADKALSVFEAAGLVPEEVSMDDSGLVKEGKR